MEYNTGLLEMLGNDPRAYHAIWSEWKQINPDTRIELTRLNMIPIGTLPESKLPPPVRANKSGIRAALWRAAGGLFRKAGWYERGRYDFFGAVLVEYVREIVQLRTLGWDSGPEQKRIALGYHAASDTLYIRCLLYTSPSPRDRS